jgi:2'-5' RNA ligase
MRTFIAIELPEQIRDALAKLEDRFKKTGADVKWVEPKNIHLTLKFLGEIDDEQLVKISEILEEVTGNKKCFQIRICSIGAFPKINYPRVIWMGIDIGDKETKELARELEKKISELGILKERRPFSSHITIGRTRSDIGRDKLVQELKAVNLLDGKNFTVTKITLFKSTLTPKGAIYEVLKEASLKAN